jgi:hypothetical protein
LVARLKLPDCDGKLPKTPFTTQKTVREVSVGRLSIELNKQQNGCQ